MPNTAQHPVSHLRFIRILQLFAAAQTREIISRLTVADIASGKKIDLSHWNANMAQALRPIMLNNWQTGMIGSYHRIQQLLQGKRNVHPPIQEAIRQTHQEEAAVLRRPAPTAHQAVEALQGRTTPPLATANTTVRRQWRADVDGYGDQWVEEAVVKEFTKGGYYRRLLMNQHRKQLGMRFDLFNPKVLDAVDQATMLFCRETNETISGDLNTALDHIRQMLKEGLPQGIALQSLAQNIRTIVQDPYRAFRIASTEQSRAVNGGDLMAAKDSEVVEKKVWEAASDACDLCLDLWGEERELDEPFYVDPKGGPYAVIMHPPRHPHCFCVLTYSI